MTSLDLNVYIGFDSSNYGQQLAYDVCKSSILRHNPEMQVHGLFKDKLTEQGLFSREDNTGATEFTYTRFLVPYLNNYQGWALFCDSDFLWFCDPAEILEKYANDKYAVMCVKHEYTQCNGHVKMDNQPQEWYPKKNWSSLMLFNCSHPSVKNLTLDAVNTQTPQWLHRMEWCKGETVTAIAGETDAGGVEVEAQIGSIDKIYNYLVGYYDDSAPAGETVRAVHFTDGGPWHEKYRDVPYGDLWTAYLTEYEKNKLFRPALFVSSFSEKLYHDYAQKFVKSFTSTQQYNLVVYTEDYISDGFPDLHGQPVEYYLESAEVNTFIQKDGKILNRHNGWPWQAGRFSHKVFALKDALYRSQGYDYLVWTDADMVYHKELPMKMVKSLLPSGYMMSFLGRKRTSECGFMIFDLRHARTVDYITEVCRYYTSGDLYKLREWHDSYVFDVVRTQFEKQGVKTHSLSGFGHVDNVIQYTPLVDYLYHHKGREAKQTMSAETHVGTDVDTSATALFI